ncbi:MAG: HEAT repeat domain-containing protein, partial [Myxococcales bacterium]
LKLAPEGRARMAAAKALGKDGSARAVDALAQALKSDGFWAVRAEAARALGEIRSDAAREALLGAIGTEHPKARRAVVKALGNFRHDAKVAAALEHLLEHGDASYSVEGEAARQVGRLRTPRALELLKRALERESHADVIRVGALDGLAELRAPEGYGPARELTRPGLTDQTRGAAARTLAKLAEVAGQRHDARELLCELAEDRMLRVAVAALDALVELGDDKALSTIRAVADRGLDGRLRRKALEAERELREGTRQSKEVGNLRDELQKLREEVRELRERLDRNGTNAAI